VHSHSLLAGRVTACSVSGAKEDINILWMGHKPKTMSEIYSLENDSPTPKSGLSDRTTESSSQPSTGV